MKELEYPFDAKYLLANKRKIKEQLLLKNNFIEKKIAILGGSTTFEIKNILELFLLNYDIKPYFYESNYNKYYEDAIFSNEELNNFNPDIIFIHTTNRNITYYPTMLDNPETIEKMLDSEYKKFESIWSNLSKNFNAVIIQNNFEYPYYRLLGNKDASDIHGKINFITRLNQKFYDYANEHNKFFINDINYVSSCYGLDKWSNQFYWYMYKYAMELPAIPYLSFNLANIIKSIYGKNKKALVLDLDNTIWGGVVGDDGVENLALGPEIPTGEVYEEFQKYLKEHENIGVILNINSKNEYENAIAGLNHPASILHPNDFIIIKANWEPKNINIKNIAEELNIGTDTLVFIDDNPAERQIVKKYVPNVSVPEILEPENYIKIIDHNGYFEVTTFTAEDLNKTDLYKDNAKRSQLMSSFNNYNDYLLSLKMKAEIKTFIPIYFERITQLTNKSNQFNLTTKRYTSGEIEFIANDENYIKLYGKLEDIFGDNGLITAIIGHIQNIKNLHIDLWIMSCRVLKRNMELAMLDTLVKKAKVMGITKIYGYYYPTQKNKMVSNFYDTLGFEIISSDKNGNKTYVLDISKEYINRNNVIKVNLK